MLAPYAVTTHLKDMAVRAAPIGFELSEVPLGQGLLPLERYIAALRRARPTARLCLEMITRDPLQVPYRTDAYWVAFDARGAATRARAALRDARARQGVGSGRCRTITGLHRRRADCGRGRARAPRRSRTRRDVLKLEAD